MTSFCRLTYQTLVFFLLPVENPTTLKLFEGSTIGLVLGFIRSYHFVFVHESLDVLLILGSLDEPLTSSGGTEEYLLHVVSSLELN